jgi:hypothetical protein
MANCILKTNKDFINLQQETGLHPDVLAAKISLWQKSKIELLDKQDVEKISDILNSYPTAKELGFQKLKMSDIFTVDEIDDLVKGYVYYLTQNLDYESVDYEFNTQESMDYLLKKLMDNDKKDIAEIILEEEFDEDIKMLAKDYLATFGIKEKTDFNDELNDENSDGGIDIKESYERDPSHMSNSELKVFLSLVPKFKNGLKGEKVFDVSPLTGIPKFENPEVIKNTLYSALSNKVTITEDEDGVKVFIDELDKLAVKNKTIRWVLNKLNKSSEKFKTNFYSVFNNSDLELFSIVLSESEFGYQVQAINSLLSSDSATKESNAIAKHTYSLTKEAFDEETKENYREYNNKKVTALNEIYSKLQSLNNKKLTFTDEDVESLKKMALQYFEMLGFDFTENHLIELINHFNQETENSNNLESGEYVLNGLNNLFNLSNNGIRHIANSFLKMEQSKNYILPIDTKTKEYKSVLEQQKFTKEVLKIINNVENDTSSPIILGAGGKSYWNKIKYYIIGKGYP